MKPGRFGRRSFLGGMAAVVGYASTSACRQASPDAPAVPVDPDPLLRLDFNENHFGAAESVLSAMREALKYAPYYDRPDPGLNQAIAVLDGVDAANIVVTAGSREGLIATASAFVQNGKKVLSFEPTYGSVFSFATNTKAEAIKLPLTQDYRQDVGLLIDTAKKRAAEIGLVYLCNPNNPTGVCISRGEMEQVLDELPAGMPVLVDEAYHHFVNDPTYAPSMSHVNRGRPVVVTRTLSKIAGMAGIRIGYLAASKDVLRLLRPWLPWSTHTVSTVARHGAMAALKDEAALAKAKREIVVGRERTAADVRALGFEVIPSQGNFVMIGLRREVGPVIEAFRREGIAVGRPFPPMTQHLRVSIGRPADMDRFLQTFKKVMASG